MLLLPCIAVQVESAANSPTLYVGLVPQPQPSSWLGFRDTLFPLNITIIVYNDWTEKFPGGNLTGDLQAPTKWGFYGLTYQIPSLDPGKSASYSFALKPEEAGVYTFSLNRLYVRSSPGSAPPSWQVSGGFLAVQIESPSTLFMVLIIVVLMFILAVLCLGTLLLWRRTRTRSGDARQPDLPAALLRLFNLSDAGRRMEGYLLQDTDDRKFESAVSWLLEIVGFRTMNLNKEAQGEKFRQSQNGVVIGSADILAYDQEKVRWLVVDCTIGTPDADKLDRIADLSRHLRSQVPECDAVVVSAKAAAATKENAERQGIIVIDRTDLEKMLGLVKAERFEKAKRVLE